MAGLERKTNVENPDHGSPSLQVLADAILAEVVTASKVFRIRVNRATSTAGRSYERTVEDGTSFAAIQEDMHQPPWPTLEAPPADVHRMAIRYIRSSSFHALALNAITLLAGGHEEEMSKMSATLYNVLSQQTSEYTGRHDLVDNYIKGAVRRFERACAVAALAFSKVADRVGVGNHGLATIAAADLESIHRLNEILIARDPRARDWTRWSDEYVARFVEHYSYLELPDLRAHTRLHYRELFVTPFFQSYDGTYNVGVSGLQRAHTELSLEDISRSLYRTVLLGHPGAGKSTISAVIAVRAAESGSSVPFFIRIRDLTASTFNLVSFLKDQLYSKFQVAASTDSIERLLSEGRALLVFDGMDESRAEVERRELADLIRSFGFCYQNCPILVTSRIIGYESAQLSQELFSPIYVKPLTDAQIDAYVHKWFRAQPRRDAPSELSATDFLEASTSMPDLITNPLLLSFILTLYEGKGNIPRTRAELYRQCIDLLLGDWDKRRRIVLDLPVFDSVRFALARIAEHERVAELTEKGMTFSELTKHVLPFLTKKVCSGDLVRARAFLSELIELCRGRAWMFTDVGRDDFGRDLFSFTHGSFREYFAASYVVQVESSPARIAEHLFAFAIDGREEVYAQVCISLHSQNSVMRGTEAIRHLLILVGTEMDRNHSKTESSWANAVEYVIRLADCVPMDVEDIELLTDEALKVLGLAARASPIQTLLESRNRHRDAAMKRTRAILVAERAQFWPERQRLRYAWFAAAAWYLTGEDGAEAINVEAANQLRVLARQVTSRADFATFLDQPELLLLEMMRERSFFADLGAPSRRDFDDLVPRLFESVQQPVPRLGPTSVVELIYSSVAQARRNLFLASSSLGALRWISAALETVPHESIGSEAYPVPMSLGISISDHWEEVLLTSLRKSIAQDQQVRRGLGFLAVVTFQLFSMSSERSRMRSIIIDWVNAHMGRDDLAPVFLDIIAGIRVVWVPQGELLPE